MTSHPRSNSRCLNCPDYGYCPECWAKYKTRQNQKVRDRRAKGLCIWCGKPAVASRLNKVGAYCKEHKVRRQVRNKTYKVRLGVPVRAQEPDHLQGTHVRDRTT